MKPSSLIRAAFAVLALLPTPGAAADPPSPYDLILTVDQAIRLFEARVKGDPSDLQNHTLLVQLHMRKAHETGDFSCHERAEAVLRKAEELRASDPGVRTLRAVLLSSRHQFGESLRLAKQLYAEDPSATQLLAILGDTHLELGNYEAAEQAYQQLVRTDSQASLAARESRLAELKGRPREAIERMEQATAAERRARVSKGGGAWYQVRLGDLHFGTGKLDTAARHYEAALKDVPGCLPALAGLGRVRAAQGKDDEAIALFKKGVAVSPDSFLLVPLGDLYRKTGNAYLAGVVHGKLVKAGQGQPAFARDLALFYADHDTNLPEALKLAEQDLQVRRDIYAHDTLAWALCKNRRYEEAAKAMSEALKLGTQDANLLYHAGMIHLGRGERDKGRDYLEKALGLNPHFSILNADKARQTLKELGNSVPPGKTGP